jgi:hypothetical protein
VTLRSGGRPVEFPPFDGRRLQQNNRPRPANCMLSAPVGVGLTVGSAVAYDPKGVHHPMDSWTGSDMGLRGSPLAVSLRGEGWTYACVMARALVSAAIIMEGADQ